MPQINYNTALVTGRAGQLADLGERDVISLINDNPRTAQVDTIVVDTATNDHEYTLAIDGVSISYTADGSAAKDEIADGLADAINGEALVSGRVVAVSDGVDTLTITARNAGYGFTTSDVDALCTLTNTTADDDADPVPFGRLVLIDANDDGYGRLAKAANLTARVVHLTPAAVNSAIYFVSIEVDGVGYKAEYTADGSATVQEIVEGLTAILNGLLPATTVAVTEDDTKLILTAEVAGKPFTVEVGSSSATATWTVSDTTATSQTDVNEAAAGVALHEYDHEMAADGTSQYEGNEVMSVAREARVLVETEDAVTSKSPVYVRLAANGSLDALGGFRGTANAGCVKLDPTRFKWRRAHTSTLAELQIRC